MDISVQIAVPAQARVWFARSEGVVRATIPTHGYYQGSIRAYGQWLRRGREACLARIADVHDGERDVPPIEFYRLWPMPVLAAMCAEWSTPS